MFRDNDGEGSVEDKIGCEISERVYGGLRGKKWEFSAKTKGIKDEFGTSRISGIRWGLC